MLRMRRVWGLTITIALMPAACGSPSETSRPTQRLPGAPCGSPSPSGDIHGSIRVDGLARTYLLRVPASPRGYPAIHHRYPLVIMFHYATGNAARMETISGMSRVADRNSFLVVYPNGRGTTWVSGAADDLDATQYDRSFRGPRGNDVHFTARLIDTISARLCVDPHRIYAGGLSSGGSMAYRLACDLSGRIAAIARSAAHTPTPHAIRRIRSPSSPFMEPTIRPSPLGVGGSITRLPSLPGNACGPGVIAAGAVRRSSCASDPFEQPAISPAGRALKYSST